jgi:biopolymer transport protein ExbD
MKLAPIAPTRIKWINLLLFLSVFFVLLAIWIMISSATIKNFGVPAYIVNTSEFDSNHTLLVTADGNLVLDSQPIPYNELESKLVHFVKTADEINLNIEFEDSRITLRKSLDLLSKINQCGITYIVVKVKP